MKKLLLFSIAIFSFWSCRSDDHQEENFNRKTDLAIENLKAKVKSVQEQLFHVNKDSGSLLFEAENKEFTPKGFLSKYFLWEKESEKSNILKGLPSEVFTLEYDVQDCLIRKNNESILNTGFSTYEHDDKGNVIVEKRFFEVGNLNRKITSKYDFKNNLIEQNTYDNQGTHLFTDKYIYNRKGQKIEFITTSVNNRDFTTKEVYSYDAKENLSSLKIFKGEDQKIFLERRYTYTKFDVKGNWTERKIQSNIDGVDSSHRYILDVRTIEYYQ
ncbi:hypothetical protein ACT4R9_01355 [Ornithobacterium rhinotracheale]|uniref:hypothetical protein n=1 Tax=Ornithobacterium rhinotracheale TaxID=28251 RepID=UPI003FA413A0